MWPLEFLLLFLTVSLNLCVTDCYVSPNFPCMLALVSLDKLLKFTHRRRTCTLICKTANGKIKSQSAEELFVTLIVGCS